MFSVKNTKTGETKEFASPRTAAVAMLGHPEGYFEIFLEGVAVALPTGADWNSNKKIERALEAAIEEKQ